MSPKLAKHLGKTWKQSGTIQRVSMFAFACGLAAGFGTFAIRDSHLKNLGLGEKLTEAATVLTALGSLDTDRIRLDIISENIANANNTHGLDGKPYQRQVVVFESAPHQATNASAPSQSTAPYRARIENDIRSPLTVYHPGHPDADSQGMVSLPNINIDEEMAEMSNASQSMTANLTIVNNYARTRAMQTLAMGRH